MNRFLPTIVVVIACIVAFVYAQQQNFFRKDEDKPKPLITFDVAQVVRLAIVDGQETIQLSRTAPGEAWRFEQPEPYPAHPDMPGYWLDDYVRLETVGEVTDTDEELAQFGLLNPYASFRVELADGAKHTLLLGDVLPIGTSMYAKWAEQSGVFKIGPQDVQRLQKSAFDFVDKQPVRVKFDRVKQMTFQWRGIQWKLNKSKTAESIFDTKWTLDDGVEMNYTTASDILDKLAFVKTEQPLVPLKQLPDGTKPDLTYTIQQEGLNGADGWSKVFVGFESEDGTIRVREQEGAYWYIIQPEVFKLAANQPFMKSNPE